MSPEPIERIRARALISQARSTRRRDEYNSRRATQSQVLFWSIVGIIDVIAIVLVILLIAA